MKLKPGLGRVYAIRRGNNWVILQLLSLTHGFVAIAGGMWSKNRWALCNLAQHPTNKQQTIKSHVRTDLADYFLLKGINGLEHLLRLNHTSDDEVQVLGTVKRLMVVSHLHSQLSTQQIQNTAVVIYQ